MPAKKFILILGDVGAAATALAVSLLIRHGGVPEEFLVRLYVFAAPFLIALWLAGFLIFGLYDLHRAKNEPAFFERLARALAFNLAVTVLLFYFIPEFRLKPLVTLVIIFTILGLFFFGWRGTYNAWLSRRTKERVLFLGINNEVAEVAQFLKENPQLGFTAAAYVKNGAGSETFSYPLDGLVLENGVNLRDVVTEHDISRIIISPEVKRGRQISRMLLAVVPLGVAIADLPRFYESVEGKVPTSLVSEVWFLENLVGMKRPKYEFLKRALDLTFVFFLGLAALLALPFIAAGILLSALRDILHHKERRAREGDGLIFFRQKRVGKNGHLFDFVKFRSQVLGAEKMGSFKAMSDDRRTYPFGTFLRKNYLDELPQLWNVFVGEMSFVGPRPERPEFVEKLEREIPFYRMRELVLPGITGWAQINMQNDASVEDAPEKLQYDLYYIKNRSIFLDIAILLKTALKLLQRSGR